MPDPVRHAGSAQRIIVMSVAVAAYWTGKGRTTPNSKESTDTGCVYIAADLDGRTHLRGKFTAVTC